MKHFLTIIFLVICLAYRETGKNSPKEKVKMLISNTL